MGSDGRHRRQDRELPGARGSPMLWTVRLSGVRTLRGVSGVLLVVVGAGLFWVLLDDLVAVQQAAGDDEANITPLFGERTLAQTVRPPPTNVSGAEFFFRGPRGVKLGGPVTLRVRARPEGEDLRAVTVELGALRRGTATRFSFAPLSTQEVPELLLRLEYPSGTEERPLLVVTEYPRPEGQPRTDYPRGTALVDGRAIDADLAFRLLTRDRRPFGDQVAALAVGSGLALLAGAALARGGVTPALLALALPLVFTLPALKNPSFLGSLDWDMNTTVHAAAERALVRERVFPGWNPYLCGGTPLAAFPEAPIFSPFFSTVLLLGPVVGFKVNFVLHTLVGFAGMLTWLRRGFRLSWPASFLGAGTVMFSSFLPLQLYEGHTRKVAFAFLPWLFFFLQRAMAGEVPGDKSRVTDARTRLSSLSPASWQLRHAAPAGAALALMFLDGSVYLSLYAATAAILWGLLASLGERTTRPLRAAGAVAVLGVLLAGVHLIPVLASQGFLETRLEETPLPLPLRGFIDIFLDPNQDPFARKFPGQHVNWTEYGAYVGLFSLALAVVGLARLNRRTGPLALVGLFFLAGALSPAVQRALAFLPILGDLRNPQRMTAVTVVVLGVFAAVGFDRLFRWLTSAPAAGRPDPAGAVRVALATLAALALGHLLYVNTETFAGMFPLPPPRAAEAPFRQSLARQLTIGTEDSQVLTVENTVRNRGSLNRCSVAAVPPSGELRLPPEDLVGAVPDQFFDQPYAGEAFFLTGEGRVGITHQTTQQASVAFATRAPATLVLNQNAHPGWEVQVTPAGGAPGRREATNARGLVATTVPPGEGVAVFRYGVPGLALGLFASAVGLLAAAWLWTKAAP